MPITNPRPRARDLRIKIGRLEPGPLNAITDVPGVRVGHTTLIEGAGALNPGVGPIRTGVTAIIPHAGDICLEKVTGCVERINGFGEVTNSENVHEMGYLEGPIVITNTWNVPRVADAVLEWSMTAHPEFGVTLYGISPIVAETSDSYLNDIRGRHVTREHVFHAIESATAGLPDEGAVGGGTGMICYEFKGGIGTASRRLSAADGGYTVGALAQTNFGWRHQLMIDGVPVGRELEKYQGKLKRDTGGSVIVVIGTDAPLTYRQCGRLARRVTHGLARTGSHAGSTSGDFAIVFSNTRRKLHHSTGLTYTFEQVVEDTDLINYLFWAVVESTEEAVLNSLFKATTTDGRDGHVVYELPIEETVEVMRRYGRGAQ
jgi:D-aminopeptidase